MSEQRSVLICANPDLNYIDGSSIWAQTIALVIAETGIASVDFLAKSKPERDELYLPLREHPAIQIIDGTRFTDSGQLSRRLSPAGMADAAVLLDQSGAYDLIVVRGLAIAKSLMRHTNLFARCWIYLTDLPHNQTEFHAGEREQVAQIARDCQRIMCQSEGFVRLWKALAPELTEAKFLRYTPVIHEVADKAMPIAERSSLVVYAGKFCADWMTLEMTEVWKEMRERHPGAVLRMIGDKIHHVPEDYHLRMKAALTGTPGLEWPGAMSRQAVQDQLLEARLGLSWRSESLNQTLEYSTKILEYGGAGCAAIINRNPLHEELLGEDYPLFANTRCQFERALNTGLEEDALAQAAADRLRTLANEHTFSRRVNQFAQWMKSVSAQTASISAGDDQPLCVLVAGHDLKFFEPIKEKLDRVGQFEFLVDQWSGHNKHDETRSRELLGRADVIVCEWCLGNLKWYSHNIGPHQRLIARFHLQERELPYVAEANWDEIEHIVYVSEFIRREGQKTFGFPSDRTSVIANYLEPERFQKRSKANDARFTIGMIGCVPSRKRLDIAVDLIEELVKVDSRYCLRIKGRHPFEYGWLAKRADELDYYQGLFRRINSNPDMLHRVIFDPAGDDVNEWLSMVGYILSPSDFESFHMAVGEGILAGCQPIVWNWDGAREIWGDHCVVDHLTEARQMVLDPFNPPCKLPPHMDPEKVIGDWINLLIDRGHGEAHP